MAPNIPDRCPDCVVNLLRRSEWYQDPEVVKRARLAYARGIPRLLSSPFFAKKEIGAITLGKTIYFRQEDQYDPHSPTGLAFLAHEIKHVEQYERLGLFRFYWRYLLDYRKSGYGTKISIEKEAYDFEEVVQKHLENEFSRNAGVPACTGVGANHKKNDNFVKIDPEEFVPT